MKAIRNQAKLIEESSPHNSLNVKVDFINYSTCQRYPEGAIESLTCFFFCSLTAFSATTSTVCTNLPNNEVGTHTQTELSKHKVSNFT